MSQLEKSRKKGPAEIILNYREVQETLAKAVTSISSNNEIKRQTLGLVKNQPTWKQAPKVGSWDYNRSFADY